MRVWAEFCLSLVLLGRHYFHCLILNELKQNLLDVYSFETFVQHDGSNSMIFGLWLLLKMCSIKCERSFIFAMGFEERKRKELLTKTHSNTALSDLPQLGLI